MAENLDEILNKKEDFDTIVNKYIELYGYQPVWKFEKFCNEKISINSESSLSSIVSKYRIKIFTFYMKDLIPIVTGIYKFDYPKIFELLPLYRDFYTLESGEIDKKMLLAASSPIINKMITDGILKVDGEGFESVFYSTVVNENQETLASQSSQQNEIDVKPEVISDVPEEISGEITEETPEEISEEALEEILEETLEEIPEEITKETPEEITLVTKSESDETQIDIPVSQDPVNNSEQELALSMQDYNDFFQDTQTVAPNADYTVKTEKEKSHTNKTLAIIFIIMIIIASAIFGICIFIINQNNIKNGEKTADDMENIYVETNAVTNEITTDKTINTQTTAETSSEPETQTTLQTETEFVPQYDLDDIYAYPEYVSFLHSLNADIEYFLLDLNNDGIEELFTGNESGLTAIYTIYEGTVCNISPISSDGNFTITIDKYIHEYGSINNVDEYGNTDTHFFNGWYIYEEGSALKQIIYLSGAYVNGTEQYSYEVDGNSYSVTGDEYSELTEQYDSTEYPFILKPFK